MPENNEFLSTKQVAELTGLEPATLHNWRWARKGPVFVKLGRTVRYPKADLVAWIESHKQSPNAQR